MDLCSHVSRVSSLIGGGTRIWFPRNIRKLGILTDSLEKGLLSSTPVWVSVIKFPLIIFILAKLRFWRLAKNLTSSESSLRLSALVTLVVRRGHFSQFSKNHTKIFVFQIASILAFNMTRSHNNSVQFWHLKISGIFQKHISAWGY